MLQRFLRDEERLLEPAASVLPGDISEEPLFENLFMPRKLPLRSVVLSAVVHLTAGYLLVSYSSFVARHPAVRPPDLNTARILELKIDLQPYVPRPEIQPPRPSPERPTARPAKPLQVPQLTAPQLKAPTLANPIPSKDVREYIPPPMQVAEAPKVARAPETLIQLDIPKPELQTQLQVPDAVILTNSPRRFLPRPVIRPPDLPKKEIPAQVVVAMDLPKIQDANGDLPVAQLLTNQTALPVRPTSRAPVAGTAPAPAEVAKGNWKSEEAPAFVALPDNPIPAHTSVVVPPAVQIGARGTENTPIQVGPPAQAGGGGNGATPQTATNIKAPDVGPPNGAANGPDPRGREAAPHPAAPLPEVAQIHLPKDGNYSVVVTQTSGLIPGTTDFLHGRPVYSVYIRAGARKDWVLQYCMPGEAAPRKTPMVVASANPAPVSAPYAYTILRPVLQFAAPGIRYAMIHGTINQNGKFEDLKEVGDRALRNMPELMQALSGWEFRPATKDGVPVAVEVLLCIPNTNG